ncbi:PAN domain-containing protein [Marinicella meishanensis]|uniref:PAN domain-containing protein n=1 Tax=Marinicella meishanensis TaxID=2873263 RepID=UPI001CBFA79B|nr:PAN domain-containing protein [Marinicella sp. NBU2979]
MQHRKSNMILAACTLIGLAAAAQAMDQDHIHNMPADADFSQYYLPNEQQPAKGAVADAAQCMKACEAAQACVVWSFKPGRFGSPASCKLSPQLMLENGEKTAYAGGATGVIESR